MAHISITGKILDNTIVIRLLHYNSGNIAFVHSHLEVLSRCCQGVELFESDSMEMGISAHNIDRLGVQ